MASNKICFPPCSIPLLPVILFLCISGNPLQAQQTEQEACAFTLREAQSLYDQGLIENIPTMLRGCIGEGFTKEERLDAYKLIILSYLFDDDQARANEAMLQFLMRYPEYEITPTDPAEFVYLLNTYDTKHKFTYGGFIGGNLAHGVITEPYSVFDIADVSEMVYRLAGLGISGGLRFTFLLADNFELSAEGIFATNSFSWDPGIVSGTNSYLDYSSVNHTESQTRVEIPVSVTYEFSLQDFRPYVRAGAAGGYLLSATTNIERKYEGDAALNDVTVPNADYTGLRKKFNLWAVTGAGVKYKIPKGYIVLDARYNTGLMLQNEMPGDPFPKAGMPVTQDPVFMGAYQDSDFRLNTFVFSLGYQRMFYKPRKKQ